MKTKTRAQEPTAAAKLENPRGEKLSKQHVSCHVITRPNHRRDQSLQRSQWVAMHFVSRQPGSGDAKGTRMYLFKCFVFFFNSETLETEVNVKDETAPNHYVSEQARILEWVAISFSRGSS